MTGVGAFTRVFMRYPVHGLCSSLSDVLLERVGHRIPHQSQGNGGRPRINPGLEEKNMRRLLDCYRSLYSRLFTTAETLDPGARGRRAQPDPSAKRLVSGKGAGAMALSASSDPRQIHVELHVPAHRVSAVTEELNLRIQGVLLKAMREDSGAGERSMLVLMGVRGEGAPFPSSSLVH